MRAKVDRIKCTTEGLCVTQCPELFAFRAGDKKAEVTRDPIPEQMHARCREAARRCPRDAIVIDPEVEESP